ncbi:hypothetical protein J5X86_49095 [Streptomyces sp. NEAU-YJ-81]|nr:hypothetical protein [Streptomyces sp. NEAU-YJ-81]
MGGPVPGVGERGLQLARQRRPAPSRRPPHRHPRRHPQGPRPRPRSGHHRHGTPPPLRSRRHRGHRGGPYLASRPRRHGQPPRRRLPRGHRPRRRPAHRPHRDARRRIPARSHRQFRRRARPHHLQLRVHERGVGETRACGTGACAAVAAARAHQPSPSLAVDYTADLPGGRLHIVVRPSGANRPHRPRSHHRPGHRPPHPAQRLQAPGESPHMGTARGWRIRDWPVQGEPCRTRPRLRPILRGPRWSSRRKPRGVRGIPRCMSPGWWTAAWSGTPSSSRRCSAAWPRSPASVSQSTAAIPSWPTTSARSSSSTCPPAPHAGAPLTAPAP